MAYILNKTVYDFNEFVVGHIPVIIKAYVNLAISISGIYIYPEDNNVIDSTCTEVNAR